MLDFRKAAPGEGEEGFGIANEVATIIFRQESTKRGLTLEENRIEGHDAATRSEGSANEIEKVVACCIIEMMQQTHQHDAVCRRQLLSTLFGVWLGKEAPAVSEAARRVRDVPGVGVESEVDAGW